MKPLKLGHIRETKTTDRTPGENAAHYRVWVGNGPHRYALSMTLARFMEAQAHAKNNMADMPPLARNWTPAYIIGALLVGLAIGAALL